MGLHSHALLDVHIESDKYEPAHIMFRVFDSATGQPEIAYRANLSEIETPPDTRVLATTPARRDDTLDRHERFNAISREGKAEIVFLGDSITQGWESAGKDAWAARFESRHAANFGISGDRTEHLLWRIDHGNFTGLSPKLIVLHIGTNNARHRLDAPEETAAGVRAILDRLRVRCPDARVLLLGIFPRGEDADDPYRRLNQRANAIITTFADDRRVFYRDIGHAFLLPDDAPQDNAAKPGKGRLKPGMMPDQLHLSPEGYRAWADAIEDDVRRLMGE
jgi:lysophospholipase L1-like esterase